MTLLPPRGERALPLLSGVLLALAHPPARFLLPAFVGLAPLLVLIHRLPPGPSGRWAATRAGLVAGAVYFGAQLYWVAVALAPHSPLAVPAWLGMVAVLAGLAGGFGWAVHRTRERLGLPLWLLAAVFWTALEWAQAHLGPLSFPWLGLGTALAPFPVLAGAADLVGARGLTAWIAAVNGLVAALMAGGHGRRAGGVVALTLVVAAPAAYGAWRAETLRLRPAARVAVVQPDIPEELKLDPAVAVDTSLSALRALTRTLAAGADGAPGLVVWPEVALPADLAASPPLAGEVRALSRAVGAPILVGAYGVEGSGDDRAALNSAFLVDARGTPGPRYDKRRLVPFIERVPFLDPGLLGRGTGDPRRFGALERGDAAPVLRTRGGTGFGVLICYESIFAPLSRRYRRDGADFLVNITNDAWYGRDEWYARTTALWQHPAHLVMRAIETRAGVARSANTGISLFIDPLGRTYDETDLFTAAVRSAVVHTTDTTTLYVRLGDWVGTLAALLAAGLLLFAPPPAGDRRSRTPRARA